MNRKVLSCVIIFIFTFLCIVRPVSVNAVEEDLVEENLVSETEEKKEIETEEKKETETEEKKETETEEKKETETEEKKETETEEKKETETEEKKETETEEKTETETEEKTETETEEKKETETEEDDSTLEYGEVYDVQKVKVITTKVDENGDLLSGAKLQILDQSGNVLDEWTSTNSEHETLLPDGTYTLHEVEAPEGYDLASDKEFTVKVEIVELDAGSEASATPCPHYTGTQMYYVEIAGKKHEVYCINQNWDTPDENSKYDGELLNSGSIRDYTKQTVPIDLEDDDVTKVIMSDGPIDVSDQSLSDQELYDKLLDIIYHRHIASEELGKQGLTYTTEEIRFITEVALKNYTNPGITERQYNIKATDALLSAFDEAGVLYKTYEKNGTRYVSYLKHNYRDYVYYPEAPLGQDIVKVDYGKGNSFGQMVAGHWNSYSNTNYLHPDADPTTQAHNAKNKQSDRDTVARYYTLFEYLISNSNPHPDDMHLYIYSSDTTPIDPAGNNNDAKYQNLLGVTGYFEDVKQQEQKIEMKDNYSTEVVEVTIKKVWDDANNQDGIRPKELTVTLSNGDKVVLNEDNNWTEKVTNLPKYEKGKKIEYSWEEMEVDGYKLADVKVDGNITTLTNTHVPEVVNISVYKIWADDENESKKHPENITITLLANGKEYDNVILSEDNEWKYIFSDLAKYDDGEEIEYSILEKEVPEGYVAAYEGDMKTGFIVHNILGEGGDVPPDEPHDNPQTSDNVYFYIISLLISTIGLIVGKIILKNN